MTTSEAPPTNLDDRVSLAVVSFGDELKNGEKTMPQFLDAAAALGFRAVELCDRSIKNVATIGDDLRRRGLEMPTVALRNDFTGPPSSIAGEIRHLRRWLAVARDLGCTTARVWTGSGRSDAVAGHQVIAAYDEVVSHAQACGVVLAVETHGGLSNDPGFLAELCTRYPQESFGVCLDFGNIAPDRRREVISALAPLTNHVHVKSYEFDAKGQETTVPLVWAIREMRTTGFHGQWVIEYEGPPPFEPGIRSTVAALETALAMPAVGGTQ